MKNNKGFTLVELLAVIIVLGIILTIVIPSAITTIDNSNRNVFATSARGLIDAAKAYVMDNDVVLPTPGTYIMIDIENMPIENYEVYNTNGGVVIANHGTLSNPDYAYYAYLSNGDYAVNGAIKTEVRDVMTGGASVAAPASGTIYINQSSGITGHVYGVTSVGGGYLAYTLYTP